MNEHGHLFTSVAEREDSAPQACCVRHRDWTPRQTVRPAALRHERRRCCRRERFGILSRVSRARRTMIDEWNFAVRRSEDERTGSLKNLMQWLTELSAGVIRILD
jgi:hypothetical protein